jgi:pimeloyl-ACP methyl ester carboxylesterase
VAGVPKLTTTDDVTIHYEIHRQNPDAPNQGVIVLLHGLSQQRHFWGPVIAALAETAGPAILVVDQRGHGESDSALSADYSINRCAEDVVEVIEAIDASWVCVVGHSWGASVALRTAAALGVRCSSVVLIDGGVFGPAMLGEPEIVREQLRPPLLGLPLADIFELMRTGDLGAYWTPEIEDALRPTFIVDDQGLARTRIGVERHMAVLDGLFAYSPDLDLAALSDIKNADLWVVNCSPLQPPAGQGLGWEAIQDQAIAKVAQLVPTARVLEWRGAIHDVPVQWPALVGGLIRSASTQHLAEGKVND